MIKKLLSLILASFLLVSPVYAFPRSNADIDDENMADISDWTDYDSLGGDSSQVTFDTKSCMKLDSGAVSHDGYARRAQDIGSFGTRTVFSVNFYCDAIGTEAQRDFSEWKISNGTDLIIMNFASDGLYFYTGASYDEAGTDLVTQGVWQEWTFDVNWTTMTVDVYVNGVLTVDDFGCDSGYGGTNGVVDIYQNAVTTYNRISYIDWFMAGSDVVQITERRIMVIQ